MITYHLNIRRPLLAREDLLDERLQPEVGDVQVSPDDRAGDDHDDRALEDLALVRPLDLLQLAPGFLDEPAALWPVTTPGLGLCRLLGWTDLRLTRARALLKAPLLLLLCPRSAERAALCSRRH